jgi:hypothetical protein
MDSFLARLYGPAARCKPKMTTWRKLVLRFCIRPLNGTFFVPGHHGYPYAPDLILGQALKGQSGHQITDRWPKGSPNLATDLSAVT